MKKETINNTGTVVKCGITTCINNSSCCIVPCKSKKDNCYCLCKEIQVIHDEYTGELQCCQWEWGGKQPQCINCQLEQNGEISIPTTDITFDIKDTKDD